MFEFKRMFDSIRSSDRVLSYEEIVLYGCDLAPLCQHGGWLTDNVVNFAATYLKNRILPKRFEDKVCLVYATLTEMIKYSEANNIDLYKEIGLSAEKWCLFILSDNLQPELAYGGCHWCLVLFDPLARRYFLFDSMPAARVGRDIVEFARKTSAFLGARGNDGEGEEDLVTLFQPCPTMSVSGDCGLFVAEYIRVILKSLVKYFEASGASDGGPPVFDPCAAITNAYIRDCRQQWLSVVGDLMKSNI